jgi:hypothetical protein
VTEFVSVAVSDTVAGVPYSTVDGALSEKEKTGA